MEGTPNEYSNLRRRVDSRLGVAAGVSLFLYGLTGLFGITCLVLSTIESQGESEVSSALDGLHPATEALTTASGLGLTFFYDYYNNRFRDLGVSPIWERKNLSIRWADQLSEIIQESKRNIDNFSRRFSPLTAPDYRKIVNITGEFRNFNNYYRNRNNLPTNTLPSIQSFRDEIENRTNQVTREINREPSVNNVSGELRGIINNLEQSLTEKMSAPSVSLLIEPPV